MYKVYKVCKVYKVLLRPRPPSLLSNFSWLYRYSLTSMHIDVCVGPESFDIILDQAICLEVDYLWCPNILPWAHLLETIVCSHAHFRKNVHNIMFSSWLFPRQVPPRHPFVPHAPFIQFASNKRSRAVFGVHLPNPVFQTCQTNESWGPHYLISISFEIESVREKLFAPKPRQNTTSVSGLNVRCVGMLQGPDLNPSIEEYEYNMTATNVY